MEELAQPAPEAPPPEPPEAELARLRQQLQHYQDVALEHSVNMLGCMPLRGAPFIRSGFSILAKRF